MQPTKGLVIAKGTRYGSECNDYLAYHALSLHWSRLWSPLIRPSARNWRWLINIGVLFLPPLYSCTSSHHVHCYRFVNLEQQI